MFPISYRDLELMLQDRGVAVDHTTLFRWIQAYAPELEKRIRPHLRACNGSWRVDETSVKVKGRWTYLYRAVDSRGQSPRLPGRTSAHLPSMVRTSASIRYEATGSKPSASVVTRNVLITSLPLPKRLSPISAAGLCAHPTKMPAWTRDSYSHGRKPVST